MNVIYVMYKNKQGHVSGCCLCLVEELWSQLMQMLKNPLYFTADRIFFIPAGVFHGSGNFIQEVVSVVCISVCDRM